MIGARKIKTCGECAYFDPGTDMCGKVNETRVFDEGACNKGRFSYTQAIAIGEVRHADTERAD